MLDHIILTVSDVERSLAFYEVALKSLNIKFFMPYKGEDGHPDLWGFGDGERAFFWIKQGKPDPAAIHWGFMAEDEDKVARRQLNLPHVLPHLGMLPSTASSKRTITSSCRSPAFAFLIRWGLWSLCAARCSAPCKEPVRNAFLAFCIGLAGSIGLVPQARWYQRAQERRLSRVTWRSPLSRCTPRRTFISASL
jgi:hypothetical protein